MPLQRSSDAPPPQDAAVFLLAKGYPAHTPVETLDLATFMRGKTRQSDEQDDGQRTTAARLQNLVEVLQGQLTDLRVYKIGAIQFDVFILGHDAQNQWYGVSTQVVET